MFVELHLIQNFAPANLNRDDAGAPKDCEFGGYRRARISSQCLKRAIRTEFKRQHLLPPERLAQRTKRLLEALTERLTATGRDREPAGKVAAALIGGLELGLDKNGKTQYLLFLGEAEIQRLVAIGDHHFDALTQVTAGENATKATRKEALPAEARAELARALDGGRAADLALFGRMLADIPERNIDAASQVAHALSTNRVSMEFDFYTAVDDLRPEETEGADMLGTVEFNSACFYRYANVDVDQLRGNLEGDDELTRTALAAFLRAAIDTVPTGKQHSMAAQNPPSFIFAVARERGLWSLANAFLDPVHPNGDGDLVRQSVSRIDGYWGQLVDLYGDAGIAGTWVAALDSGPLPHLSDARVRTVSALVEGVLRAVQGGAR